MRNCFLFGILAFFAFVLSFSSYGTNLQKVFVRENTFLFLYANCQSIQNTKIYASINNNLIEPDKKIKDFLQSAEKFGINQKDIAELYFTLNLKPTVKISSQINNNNVFSVTGIKLKKDFSNADLLKLAKDLLKNSPSATFNSLNKDGYDIISIVDSSQYLYTVMAKPNLIIISSNLPEMLSLLNTIKSKDVIFSNTAMKNFISTISQESSVYLVGAIPDFMAKELQNINTKLKQNEQQTMQIKIANIIRNLRGLTAQANAQDVLSLNISVFFQTNSAAQDFNELLTHFMPLLKIQLFMMVKNSSLPCLNTISINAPDTNCVSVSAVINNDDVKSFYQIINK